MYIVKIKLMKIIRIVCMEDKIEQNIILNNIKCLYKNL